MSEYDALLDPPSEYDALLEPESEYDALLSEPQEVTATSEEPLPASAGATPAPASNEPTLADLDRIQQEQARKNLADYQMTREEVRAQHPDWTDEQLTAFRADATKRYKELAPTPETQKPLITIPKPQSDTVLSGIIRGAETVVESLTTPENLMLMAPLAKAPVVVQKLAALGFGANMAKELPAQTAAVLAAETPSEKAERATELVAAGALAGLALGHGSSPREIVRAEQRSIPGGPIELAPKTSAALKETKGEEISVVEPVKTPVADLGYVKEGNTYFPKTEGAPAETPPPVERIVGTALNIGEAPLRGPSAFASHQDILSENPQVFELPEAPDLNKQGGFIARAPDGTERFVTRSEATEIAKNASQVPKTKTGELHSQDITETSPTGPEFVQRFEEGIAEKPPAPDSFNAVRDVQATRIPDAGPTEPVGITPSGAPSLVSGIEDIAARFLYGELGAIKATAGEPAMRAKLQGDIDLAKAAAAVRKSREELLSQITVKKPWWMPKTWTTEYRKFMAELLPAARYLNAVEKLPDGSFRFEDFAMRAGTVPKGVAKRLRLSVGSIVPTRNKRTGVSEPLEVTEILSDGRAQLGRRVSPAEQEAVLQDMQARHPANAWLLEKWIDPTLRDARIEHNGMELADFNRFALSDVYGMEGLPGYTPDIMLQRGLVGSVLNWFRASGLPGTRYKTGAAAEAGRLENLVTGFYTRQAELLKQRATAKASAELLDTAAKPHKRGDPIPEGFVEMKTGIDGLVSRLAATRGKLAAELGVEAADLVNLARKYEGKHLIVPKTTFEILVRQMAHERTNNVVVRAIHALVSQFNKGLLARPMSAMLNALTNDIFIGMDAARNGVTSVLAATLGEGRLARESGEVAARHLKGMFTDRFYNREYRRVMDEVLPPELFTDQNLVAAITGDTGNIRGLADMALEILQYRKIDEVSKQRFGSAYLKTYAREAAQAGVDAGLIPDNRIARQQFALDYMKNAPDRVLQDIMLTTNQMIGNYADAPMWLKAFNRTPVLGPAIAPFVNFKYQLFRQQAKLATSALRETLTAADPGATRWWTEKRIRALADLISVTTVVGGTAWWLSQDDEEGRRIGRAKDEEGKLLPPEDITANRIRANLLARFIALNTDENDYWLYTRNFPYLNEAAMIAAYRRDGTFEAENFFGDVISQGVAWKAVDLLMGKSNKYNRFESTSAQGGKLTAEFWAGSVVPLPWIQLAREIDDPFKRQTTATKTKPLKLSDFQAGARNVFPFTSDELPKRRDREGRAVERDKRPAAVKFVSPINLKEVSR